MEKAIKNLKILQWNCRSVLSKVSVLSKYIYDFDICLLSETWLIPKNKLYFKNYDIIRVDRSNNNKKGGGVAIIIKNKFKYKVRKQLWNCKDKLEVVAIDIYRCNNEPMTIASCYRPPNNDLITNEEWCRFFKQFQRSFLITGDFNAHHYSWSDLSSCSHGNNLYQATLETDIALVNSKQPTYINMHYSTESSLDLAFSDWNSLLSLNWKVCDDTWGSDHFPIFITYNEQVKTNQSFRMSRIYS